jgi:hypothetical protein
MEPEPRHIHIVNCGSGVEPRENIPQLYRMFRPHAARVVIVIQALESFVAD